MYTLYSITIVAVFCAWFCVEAHKKLILFLKATEDAFSLNKDGIAILIGKVM